MPCTQTGSLEGDHALYLSQLLTKKQTALTKKQTAVTTLAQHLCTMCQLADKNKIPIPSSVKPWWKKHKKMEGRK